MEKNAQTNITQIVNKKKPKDDILNIVKQFVNYFEDTDRGRKDDNSSKRS